MVRGHMQSTWEIQAEGNCILGILTACLLRWYNSLLLLEKAEWSERWHIYLPCSAITHASVMKGGWRKRGGQMSGRVTPKPVNSEQFVPPVFEAGILLSILKEMG